MRSHSAVVINTCFDNVLENVENGKFPYLDMDNTTWWYLKYRIGGFGKKKMNQALPKLYLKEGDGNFGKPWVVTILI